VKANVRANEMKRRSKFARWVWLILGGLVGALFGHAFGVEKGYPIFLVVITSFGGAIAGAGILTAFMWLHYVFYRMDVFTGE
jgi:hypothetical protein